MAETINTNQETIGNEQLLIQDLRKLIRYKNNYPKIYNVLKNGYEEPISNLDATRNLDKFKENFPTLYEYIKSGDDKEISIFLNSQKNSREFILEDVQEKLSETLEKENYVEEVLDEQKNVFNEMLYKNGTMDENGLFEVTRSINDIYQRFENLSNLLNSIFKENMDEYEKDLKNEVANLANTYFVLMDIYLNKLSNIPEKELPKDGKIFFNEIYCRELFKKMYYIDNEIRKKVLKSKINDFKTKISNMLFKEGGIISTENEILNLEEGDIQYVQEQKPLKTMLMKYDYQLSIDKIDDDSKKYIKKLYDGLENLHSLVKYLTSYEGTKEDLEIDEFYKNSLFSIKYFINSLGK